MKIGKYDIRRDNVGNWPLHIRLALLIIVTIVLLFVAYWFDFQHQINDKLRLAREESTLKLSLAHKQQIAVNLPNYQAQFKIAQSNLHQLVQKLPTQAEIPALVEEISKLGQANGLSFSLLEPMQQQTQKFYIQLPLHIIVSGNYQQITHFIVALANMKRITSVENFKLINPTDTLINDNPKLDLDFEAMTYRYAADAEPAKKAGGTNESGH